MFPENIISRRPAGPTYLQVVNDRGEWVNAGDSVEFPAGLPKTMTVDLTGKFLDVFR